MSDELSNYRSGIALRNKLLRLAQNECRDAFDRVATLTIQRDALLAACKAVDDVWEHNGNFQFLALALDDKIPQVKAAIALATSTAGGEGE